MSGIATAQRRSQLKRALARVPDRGRPDGVTVLIYHRVGGPATDELDVSVGDFEAQLAVLAEHRVVDLGSAVQGLEQGDTSHRVVVTFDDGFADVYEKAWPLLREHRMPFTVYVTSACIGGTMSWPGSTAKGTGAPALSWAQLDEMVASGLCTVGNHTATHVTPDRLDEYELDRCTEDLVRELGVVPEHFAYTWGRPVPAMDRALRERFRSAATGHVGRNLPGSEPMRLARIPVRGSDPVSFFRAKLTTGLRAERLYGMTVASAKRVGVHA